VGLVISTSRNLGIIAGHGGTDTGCSGHGIDEADYVLLAALRLERMLDDVALPGLDYFVNRRDSAEQWPLSRRGEWSRNIRADLIIELHCDTPHYRTSIHGLWCYHWPTNLRTQNIGVKIRQASPAALMNTTDGLIRAATGFAYPRVRNCLEVHRADALLVELGHLNDSWDASALKDPMTQHGISLAILAGITHWLSDLNTHG